MAYNYENIAAGIRDRLMSGDLKLRNPDAWRYYNIDQITHQQELDREARQAELAQQRRDNRQNSIASIIGDIGGPLAGAFGTSLFGGGSSGSGGGIGSAISGGLDSIGGVLGLSGSASGSNIGPLASGSDYASALGMGGEASTGAGLLGSVAPYAAAPLAAYTGYETVRGLGNVAKGNDLSGGQQAALALPTMGASFAYNPIKNAFGGGVSQESKDRSSIRGTMDQMGLNGEQYKGQDYNVDPNAQGVGAIIGGLNPLGEIIAYRTTGGDNPEEQQRMREQATGYMVNGVTGSGAKQNAGGLRQYYEQAGLNRDSASQLVNQMLQEGVIDQDRANAYLASIDRLFSTPTQQGSTRNLTASADSPFAGATGGWGNGQGYNYQG